MKLKDYYKNLTNFLISYPEARELEVACDIDSVTRKVDGTPVLITVKDPEDYEIKITGFFNGDEEDMDNIKVEDANMVLIN